MVCLTAWPISRAVEVTKRTRREVIDKNFTRHRFGSPWQTRLVLKNSNYSLLATSLIFVALMQSTSYATDRTDEFSSKEMQLRFWCASFFKLLVIEKLEIYSVGQGHAKRNAHAKNRVFVVKTSRGVENDRKGPPKHKTLGGLRSALCAFPYCCL